jgi:hypothetical protein
MTARKEETVRPLTEEELGFFHRLFDAGHDDLRSFEPQLKGMLARRTCSCGCPSIELRVSEGTPLGQDRGERIVGDFAGETSAGDPVGVLVFQERGRLAELEVYSMDGLATGEFGFPQVDSLKMIEWEPSPHNPNIRVVRSPKSPE